jgi:fumarate hydratase class II
MHVNRQVFERVLSLNPILVTSLNPVVGYLKAAEIGKIAQRENRPVLDVAMEQTDIPREKLQRLLDPKNLADGSKS